jgi:hypothetical protein
MQAGMPVPAATDSDLLIGRFWRRAQLCAHPHSVILGLHRPEVGLKGLRPPLWPVQAENYGGSFVD